MSSSPAVSDSIPLLFSLKDVVLGNGFVAGFQLDGRALLETDPIDAEAYARMWVTGVSPVGVAGGGHDRGAAFMEFRKALIEVVFDLAAAAGDFDEFRAACAAFFSSDQEIVTAHWQDAVATVRRSGLKDWALQSGSAERPVAFEIVDLTHQLRATENRFEYVLQMAI